MNTKFLAAGLVKLVTYTKIEVFIAGLTLASVVVAMLVYVPQVDTQSYLQPIFIFDFIVVFILALDFYARAKISKQGFRMLLQRFLVALYSICTYEIKI